MRKLAPVRTVDPSVDLLTLEECRDHLRRDDSDDDAKISLLIGAVTSHLDGADGMLGRALLSQTWEEDMDGFPVGDRLMLALSPVISISSITYYDIDGDQQAFAASNYRFHNRTNGAYVSLKQDSSWPQTDDRDDAVKVTHVAGYGASRDAVPAAIRQAALLMVGEWYELREEIITGTIVSRLPDGVMALLRRFIRPHF